MGEISFFFTVFLIIREVELDHLGDILICSEFSGEINIDGVNEESLGGRDIIVSLLSAHEESSFGTRKLAGLVKNLFMTLN